MKLVYEAVTEEQSLVALDDLDEKWGKDYQISIRSWRNNWDEQATFFKYLWLGTCVLLISCCTFSCKENEVHANRKNTNEVISTQDKDYASLYLEIEDKYPQYYCGTYISDNLKFVMVITDDVPRVMLDMLKIVNMNIYKDNTI